MLQPEKKIRKAMAVFFPRYVRERTEQVATGGIVCITMIGAKTMVPD